MKLGRNEQCHCGSGKKYKKCHLREEEGIEQALKHFASLPKEPFEKGGFLTGRGFIDTVFQDKRARAVGNVVYMRPLDETFHIFLLRRLVDTFGVDWLTEQNTLPENERHPMFAWFEEMRLAIERGGNSDPTHKIVGLDLTGNMKALLAIAYDFYSLQHCQAKILPKLLKRLKDKKQFQGARYEIAVGGLVVRSGFQIEWINEKEKHCEFIGTHKITGDKVAFEAKSHHRGGVLGQPNTKGDFDAESARIKVLDHIKEALDQSPKDTPLLIFDDLNLPLTPGMEYKEKRWFKEVEAQLEPNKFSFHGTQYAGLFLTNFSWHFENEMPKELRKHNEVMAYFHVGGPFSLKSETILSFLKPAAEQYGFVPPKEEEFEEVRRWLERKKS